MRPVRRAAERGAAAEAAAVDYLRQLGLQIVATNLRLGRLELDIVARDGPLIIVVEVRIRGRGAWTSAFGSLSAAKRRRLRQAGQRLWQRRYKNDESASRLRYDVVCVHDGPGGALTVEHVPAAL